MNDDAAQAETGQGVQVFRCARIWYGARTVLSLTVRQPYRLRNLFDPSDVQTGSVKDVTFYDPAKKFPCRSYSGKCVKTCPIHMGDSVGEQRKICVKSLNGSTGNRCSAGRTADLAETADLMQLADCE